MKLLLSLILFLFLSHFSSAQLLIDGEPIDSLMSGRFVEVCTYQMPMQTKVKAVVNYGQALKAQLGAFNSKQFF